MRVVRPININLSIMDVLLIIEGLTYLKEDKERHEIDREGAKQLIDKIHETVSEQAIVLERGD